MARIEVVGVLCVGGQSNLMTRLLVALIGHRRAVALVMTRGVGHSRSETHHTAVIKAQRHQDDEGNECR